MQTVLITGGTGLIGNRLSEMLIARGYQVIILSRTKKKSNPGAVTFAEWDIKKGTIDIAALQSADYIIHLAGAGVVEKRWTAGYKQEIVSSRTESSKLILENLQRHSNQVKAIISASAIGWYGPDKNPAAPFTETDRPFTDFLAQTCVEWEASISNPGNSIRTCRLRTGIVLGKSGGALAEFIKPVRFGIAAILGSGKQMISWIHIDDLCRMYIHAMENESLHGSYNAVAPMPVSNKELTLMLAERIKGKFFIPVHIPSFMLKFIMGESSIEVLKSCTVSCEKIKSAGFTFLYPSPEAALKEITGK